MPEMPTLGAPPKKSPIVPVAITAVIVGLAAGAAYWVNNRPDEGPATPTEVAPPTLPVAEVAAPPLPVPPWRACPSRRPRPGCAPSR